MPVSVEATKPQRRTKTMSGPVRFPVDNAFEQTAGSDFSLAQSHDQAVLEKGAPSSNVYHRYHIETQNTPDIVPLPPKFQVKVKKHRLIAMVLKELFELKGDLPVALSRPCVYGVFSRPVGGLAPREELCVGCLRCTVQFPAWCRFTRIQNGSAWVIHWSGPRTLTRSCTRRAPGVCRCAARATEAPSAAKAGMVSGPICPKLCARPEMAFMAGNSFRRRSILAKNRPFCILTNTVRSLARYLR